LKVKQNYLILQILLVLTVVISGCAHHGSRTHDDLIKYGIDLAQKGYWHEAAVHWRMVLNEDPENVAALNNLAVAAEVSNHMEEAEHLFTIALNYRSEDIHIRRNFVSLKERGEKENVQESEDEEAK